MQSYILISILFFLDGGYRIPPMVGVFDSETVCSEKLLERASNPFHIGGVTIIPKDVGKFMYRIDYTKLKNRDGAPRYASQGWSYQDYYCIPVIPK